MVLSGSTKIRFRGLGELSSLLPFFAKKGFPPRPPVLPATSHQPRVILQGARSWLWLAFARQRRCKLSTNSVYGF